MTTIRALQVITPQDCRAQTCDCEPGHCAFPLCLSCDAPLLNGEKNVCAECENKHLRGANE